MVRSNLNLFDVKHFKHLNLNNNFFSFQSYSLRRSSEDDKTDCISLLRPLVTEIPIWDDYCKELKGKKLDHCLPPELSHLENAFCDLR